MADKYALLQKILKALGLSEERIDRILALIDEGLAEEGASEPTQDEKLQRDLHLYRLRNRVLTPAERTFYQALTAAVDGWAVICPKVRLEDIFYVRKSAHRRSARNRIKSRHVDFLLCDPQTMRPLLGVELNDRSHQRSDRKERDHLVVGAFEAAGLPLAGIRVRAHYPVPDLARFLRQKAGIDDEPRPSGDSPAPACPECGADMVLRTARRGPQAGQSFWGCFTYPECRGTVPLD